MPWRQWRDNRSDGNKLENVVQRLEQKPKAADDNFIFGLKNSFPGQLFTLKIFMLLTVQLQYFPRLMKLSVEQLHAPVCELWMKTISKRIFVLAETLAVG